MSGVGVQPVRFLADAMLGRLARWLRAIGADTLQLPVHTPDHVIVARAHAEDRVVLTRDRHLLRELRPARSFEVKSDVPLEQLESVVRHFALGRPHELLTRCLVDNTPLAILAGPHAMSLMPPKARGLAGVVRRCATCGRVYWRGSHVRRMEAALDAALPDWR